MMARPTGAQEGGSQQQTFDTQRGGGQGREGGPSPARTGVARFGRQHEVVGGGVEGDVEDPAVWRGSRLVALELCDQGLLDPEDGVGAQVGVAGDEHVGDQPLEAGGLDHEVDVRRPHDAAAGGGEQLAHRAVDRDRVGGRPDRPEAEAPVPVREQVPAAARVLEVGVLDVVEALVVGLPDLEAGAGDGLAVQGADRSLDEAGLTGGAAREVVAQLEPWRAVHVEGPEHGGLGGPRRPAVVYPDGEHGDAEDVGQEDELLALAGGDLPGAGQEVDAAAPLLLGELHLPHEGVQVPDEALHDRAEPVAGRLLEAGEHRLRQLVVHDLPSRTRISSLTAAGHKTLDDSRASREGRWARTRTPWTRSRSSLAGWSGPSGS